MNVITRIFNRIFSPNKIGSSMLRHMYLSSKYGTIAKEMSEDAKMMGHSVGTAQEIYVKI